MGSIFLSHSSRDNDTAGELKERLAAWGHTSVFLDFDPAAGIPPGRDWERELYHRLRTCRAVLVLCSRHSMASHWCFAEITHAKSLGKPVFPLKVAPCEVHPVLSGSQVLDCTDGRDETWERLEDALRQTLGEGFPWQQGRPPYPGLMAFQEEDAAIFFGREAEIHAGLEGLERLRRFGAGRALMVLGASGSGKSSLVRAGLIPRLRRDDRRWLVLPPCRPLDRPWRELAICLAGAFSRLGRDRGWRDLQQDLERAAAAPLPSPEVLLHAARDLRLASGRGEARVLLTIDQAEELLRFDAGGAQALFAPILQAALASPDSPLMAIATLRTDLLADFQHHPATRDLEFDDLRLGPLATDGLIEIVEGPARVADIDLEDGLSDAVVEEAATEDALPLLAFAMRELYERFGKDRRLTLAEYRDALGGLGGSIAQAAESVLAARPLSGGEERCLRDAMLALARIDAEGRYRRRAVKRQALAPEIHHRIDAFVEARLLVARDLGDDQQVEVAHEALFRSWGRLRDWLNEDRELLLWRKRLDTARREWQRTGRHRDTLLSGPALAEGRRWLEHRGGQLAPDERAFLTLSVRQDEKRRTLRRLAAGSAVLALALIAVGGLWLWQRAEEQRRRAEDITRGAAAGELLGSDPTWAAQALLEVEDLDRLPRASIQLRRTLHQRLAEHELVGHRGPVTAAAFSPAGDRLLTASWDQTARLWGLAGEVVELRPHDDLVNAVAYGPRGEQVLTVTNGGTVRVWNADGSGEPLVLRNPTHRVVAAFGPTGERLLVVANNGTARVWPLDRLRSGGSDEPLVLGSGEHFILQAAFNPAGDRVVTVAANGAVVSWPADRPDEGSAVLLVDGPLRLAELGPLGNRLLGVSEDGAAKLWRLDGLEAPREIGDAQGPIVLARFSRFEDRLLSVTDKGASWLWDLARGAPPQLVGKLEARIEAAAIAPRGDHFAVVTDAGQAWLWSGADRLEELRHPGVSALAFAPRGDRLATASVDHTARIWELRRAATSSVLRGHRAPLLAAAFSADGDRVLTASLDGDARIWPAAADRPPRVLEHRSPLYLAAFDASGSRVLTVADDGRARIWSTDGEAEPVVLADADGVETAVFSPTGDRVAVTTFAFEVKLWQGRDEPVTLGRHGAAVVSVAFSPGGEHLVSAALDGTATVWNLEAGGDVELAGHEEAVLKAAFSPDGRRVVTASRDQTARVWNTDGSGAAIVLRGHANDVVAAAFSPDGGRVVTGSNDFEVWVWDLRQPDKPIVLGRHGERVTRVSFSSDGAYVVSASGDATARVWRADGAGQPQVLAGHGARVTAAAFSPDDSAVVTASEDGTARLWLISADGLERALRDTVAACLRPQVRRDYLGESLGAARRAYEACRRRAFTGAGDR